MNFSQNIWGNVNFVIFGVALIWTIISIIVYIIAKEKRHRIIAVVLSLPSFFTTTYSILLITGVIGANPGISEMKFAFEGGLYRILLLYKHIIQHVTLFF